MPLPYQKIIEWGNSGGISPFNPDNVNPASIDLCWSGRVRYPDIYDWGMLETRSALHLRTGSVVLLDTLETVAMPLNLCGMLLSKTKLGRAGTFLGHVGWVDPGFKGTLTFQLHHPVPFTHVINEGDRVLQLVLLEMNESADLNYKDIGTYYGQSTPTERRK